MTTFSYFLEILIKVPPSEKKNLETLPYLCSWVFYLHLGNLSASQVAQWQRIHLPVQETQETWVHSQGLEDPLEKEMAPHSSILIWEIRWTEEHGGLYTMGLQRVV